MSSLHTLEAYLATKCPQTVLTPPASSISCHRLSSLLPCPKGRCCLLPSLTVEIRHNIHDKTVHWKFIQSLEPPRMVHARCTNIITKENMFAQITVRFHTQQVLAIYDRFGRLMHGSEILAKDVLEYVVFEKHLSNQYGTWRLHEKIIPDWMPPPEPSLKTFRLAETNNQ
uniref:Large ribosomal subunit protein mL45 n=2 Tax=Timema TaxID=61471 RepID=A0A7R9PCD0_TIMCA|nr:unnamed protein product [Timema californicum]